MPLHEGSGTLRIENAVLYYRLITVVLYSICPTYQMLSVL